jgi:hypothetical protein
MTYITLRPAVTASGPPPWEAVQNLFPHNVFGVQLMDSITSCFLDLPWYDTDGLTEQAIDELIRQADALADQGAEPTSALLDGTAARRRQRRMDRRTVRTLPVLPVVRRSNDSEAA